MRGERCAACNEPGALAVRHEKWGFAIAVCARCGTGATVVPEGFDATSIYDGGYFTGGHRDGYVDYAGSEPVLRREFRRTLGTLQQYVARGRLLEIGCAYGYFLDEARRSFDVEGLELSPDGVAACRARGLDVRREPLSAAALEGRGPFDAAVMLDVIEHLADPFAGLCALRDALAPGGHLVLTTGDFGSVSSRAMGAAWRLLTPPQHLFFFTRAGLTAMLRRAGFSVVSTMYPWKLVPLGLALFQLGRPLGVTAVPEWAGRVAVPVNLFDAVQVVARRD